MNQGFGKDLYRKGNSVKSFGPFTERPALKTEKLLSSSPSQKSALMEKTEKNGQKSTENHKNQKSHRPLNGPF